MYGGQYGNYRMTSECGLGAQQQDAPSWALEKWARSQRVAMSRGFHRNTQLWYSAGMQLEHYAHILALVRCCLSPPTPPPPPPPPPGFESYRTLRSGDPCTPHENLHRRRYLIGFSSVEGLPALRFAHT